MHAFFQNDCIIWHILTYIHRLNIWEIDQFSCIFFNLLHRSKVQPIGWPWCAWIASGKGVARDTCGSKKWSYERGWTWIFWDLRKFWCMKSQNGFAKLNEWLMKFSRLVRVICLQNPFSVWVGDMIPVMELKEPATWMERGRHICILSWLYLTQIDSKGTSNSWVSCHFIWFFICEDGPSCLQVL